MIIELNKSLEKAHLMFNMIKLMSDNFEAEANVQVQCFDNCREQGYVFIVNRFHIAVAAHRTSDDYVVYCYKKTEDVSNLPADDEWKDVKYFGEDNAVECAKYIIKRIRGKLNGI